MSDDDDEKGTRRTEAFIFDSQKDGARYAKIGMEVCKLLESQGLSETELVPFLAFYLAHVMDCHLNCDTKMFRSNMLEFGSFCINIFELMQQDDGDDDEGAGQLRH